MLRSIRNFASFAAAMVVGGSLFAQGIVITSPVPKMVDGRIRVQGSGSAPVAVNIYATAPTQVTKTLQSALVTSDVENNPPLTFDKAAVDAKTTKSINVPQAAADRVVKLTTVASYTSTDTAGATKTDSLPAASQEFVFDVTPPKPLAPAPERFPDGSGRISVGIFETDIDPSSVKPATYVLTRAAKVASGGSTSDGMILIQQNGDAVLATNPTRIIINYASLESGNYHLKISGLKDVVGNTLSTAAEFDFTVSGSNQNGQQIEFPQFLTPGGTQKNEFDPGDLVDTRVIQLYYFTDARRVAEIINRYVQNFNQAGYDQAQRFANDARKAADDSVDSRRFKEVQAVEAAQKTRALQNQLQQEQEDIAKAKKDQQLIKDQLIQINHIVSQIGQQENLAVTNAADPKDPPVVDINALLKLLDEKIRSALTSATGTTGAAGGAMSLQEQPGLVKLAAFTDGSPEATNTPPGDSTSSLDPAKQKEVDRLRSVQRTLQTLEIRQSDLKAQLSLVAAVAIKTPSVSTDQIANSQKAEIDARNAVVTAEATELRTQQEKFRREVAAEMTDPDTFAAGKMSSIDPVTQVSITVVGTSRLQLRGPIKGINKIRRMVHQIDSPVGQVKIGIHTVQVNGEHGDRMDFVYEKINQEIMHSRFLVNTSGQLLRRAVQEVATQVAFSVDQGYIPQDCPPEFGGVINHDAGFASLDGTIMTNQKLRDWRYLYAFYGADFIDELRRMDSELLNTENKMLSLHSMDTISLAGALTVTALADHPVRLQILQTFQELVATELPEREVQFVQSSTQVNRFGTPLSKRFRQAMWIDAKNADQVYFNATRTYHFPSTVSFFNQAIPGQGTLNPIQYSTIKLAQALKAQLVAEMEFQNLVLQRSLLEKKDGDTESAAVAAIKQAAQRANDSKQKQIQNEAEAIAIITTFTDYVDLSIRDYEKENPNSTREINAAKQALSDWRGATLSPQFRSQFLEAAVGSSSERTAADRAEVLAERLIPDDKDLQAALGSKLFQNDLKIQNLITNWQTAAAELEQALQDVKNAEQRRSDAEQNLFAKRLLGQFMDEQEEKSVALMEALREHSSNVDNYLKRLAIAVEDDVTAQFYEPAFQRIRRVSRTWDVTLGQIESTTILTNNRTLAKVDPAATFEFDLPHRDIAMVEAVRVTKALVDEYGNLLNDPTFLAGAAMMGGNPATGVVGDNAPLTGIPGLETRPPFGSELSKLVPDPAIYKFETGTGFQIRPVIQPDGNSITYTFDYMYSTNVREPVRADEKHLGRIKRHFVHTDVQTSSYELREVSRYTVALKAARTERGVPLFEDIPGVGALFRPLPSAESSLQTNIILASSTIYPTVFDLMGLRWSPFVDDLSSTKLQAEKESQQLRREELRTQLLEDIRRNVDRQIGLPSHDSPSTIRIPSGF